MTASHFFQAGVGPDMKRCHIYRVGNDPKMSLCQMVCVARDYKADLHFNNPAVCKRCVKLLNIDWPDRTYEAFDLGVSSLEK